MYEEISANRRNSWLLVAAVTAILVVLGFLVGEYLGSGYVGVGFAATIAVIMSLSAYYSGDKMVLSMSRARRIERKDNPKLSNVVEELAIAGGLPIPAIYMIDDSAPNAFATGRDPEHASVAITTGLIEKLNRDELQGVMAHELSHVGNRDILFATMGVSKEPGTHTTSILSSSALWRFRQSKQLSNNLFVISSLKRPTTIPNVLPSADSWPCISFTRYLLLQNAGQCAFLRFG